jgi:short chain dehydrogenase
MENAIDSKNGARGTLIFTGATASLRGNVTTSAFAAGKFGLRALSQSLAKEFGKQNIHVAHVSLFLRLSYRQSYNMMIPNFFSHLLDNHRWRFVQAYVTL